MERKFQYAVTAEDVQQFLKDVLGPMIGFRDTSVSWAQLSDSVQKIQHGMEKLQESPRNKWVVLTKPTKSFIIEIPKLAYKNTSEFREPVFALFDLNYGQAHYDFGLQFPAFYSQEQSMSPTIAVWCTSCNKKAFDVLKHVIVETIEKAGRQAYRVLVPLLDSVTRGGTKHNSIMTYSEHPSVTPTEQDFWDSGVHVKNKCTVKLGAVTNIKEVPDQEHLVYSRSVRRIENVSAEEMNLRLQAQGATDPTHCYLIPESVSAANTVALTFDTKEYFIQRIPDLKRDFKTDWSRLELHFGDMVTDLDDAFSTVTDITKAPIVISGRKIQSMNRLFKGCTHLTTLPNQSTLFQDCPELQSVESAFENTGLTGDVSSTLFASNRKLWNLKKAFKNTKVSSTYEFWNHYQQVPTESGQLQEIYIDGRACFAGCTSLHSSSMPEDWKSESIKQFTFHKRDHFDQMLPRLLTEFSTDFSTLEFTFGKDVSLEGLFQYSGITKAPKSIRHQGNYPNVSYLFAFSYLEEISESTLAQLPNIVTATGMFHSCFSLRSVPKNIFANHKKIVDYQDIFRSCTSIVGETPKDSSNRPLWQLAGTSGYPTVIHGMGAFAGSSFTDYLSIPEDWR